MNNIKATYNNVVCLYQGIKYYSWSVYVQMDEIPIIIPIYLVYNVFVLQNIFYLPSLL